MIDKSEINHNIKVGSDTDIYLARICTKKTTVNNKYGKIMTKDSIYDFPYLTRTTGNSLKPTTEYIQSNELRKGGAESAPRPGNTSVDGSLDVEVSPNTFDDNICSAFDNEWKTWESDENSESNIDNVPCADGKFLTRASKLVDPTDPTKGYDEDSYNESETFGQRKLLSTTDGDGGLISVHDGTVVNEMTFGKKQIEYLIVMKYGGAEGEDRYHIFNKLGIGTLDLNAEIGAIVTGSFGIMGDSSSDILNETKAKAYLGGNQTTKFYDGVTTGNSFVENLPAKATDTDQFTSREGDMWINGKNITFAQSLAFNVDKNMDRKYALFVKNPVSKKSLRKAITLNLNTYFVPDSDELYNLANNNKTFEVLFAFEDKGYMNDLKSDDNKPEYIYLVQIFNSKSEDKDLSASGEGDYTMTIPLRSFGERLCRIFKIALPKVTASKAVKSSGGFDGDRVVFTPNILMKLGDLVAYDSSAAEGTKGKRGIRLTAQVDDGAVSEITPVIGYEIPDTATPGSTKIVAADGTTDVSATANVILDLVDDDTASDTYGHIYVKHGIAQTSAEQTVKLTMSWNGAENICNFKIPASA